MMRKITAMPLVCLAGVMLNMVVRILVAWAGLPLYLDTIFTVAVTLTGGLFWGILCGALSNLVGYSLYFWGWEGYLFTICNVATACITFGFVRLFPRELDLVSQMTFTPAPVKSRYLRGEMDRVVVLILLSFALCIAMSVLGGLVAVLIQALLRFSGGGQDLDPDHVSVVLSPTLYRLGLPVIIVEILSRIPINIIDRLITAFAGYGIARIYLRSRNKLVQGVYHG